MTNHYAEFWRLFNAEEFFEAHEVLELMWRAEKGGDKDFYHGLIQVAAVFVHIQKGTPEGGKQLFQTSSKYLDKYRPIYRNLDINRLLEQTRASLLEGKAFPKVSI